jgi:hypothetical protein
VRRNIETLPFAAIPFRSCPLRITRKMELILYYLANILIVQWLALLLQIEPQTKRTNKERKLKQTVNIGNIRCLMNRRI